MTCAELEILLCDYVDGTLPAAPRIALEKHISGCNACAEMARDVSGALAFLEAVPAAEPPAALLARISRQVPERRAWWAKLWSGSLDVLLQPRFAMGMAMTILSISMIVRLGRIETRELSRAELDPLKMWQSLDDRTYRVWDRTVKYYDNMPLVMDLQSRWQDLEEQSQSPGTGEANQGDRAR